MGKPAVTILLVLTAGCASGAATELGVPHRFTAQDNDTALAAMARVPPRLPLWARIQAESLPGTTALQVDLDFLHRKRNPLGPVLAARIRRAVAEENRCAYALESADADLAAAKAPDDPPPEPERLAVEFARRLTLDGAGITDEEVAALIAALGPDDAVAVVHTTAHANFQNRIFLALGLTTEPGGAALPQEVLPPSDAQFPVPERSVPSAAASGEGIELAPWRDLTWADLRESLETQKARPPRIPMPDETRRARIPRPARDKPARVTWGRVSTGYQPVLTGAWFRTMDAFDREANLDQAFASTVFWVVTRTSECFY